jgi:acetyltransferase
MQQTVSSRFDPAHDILGLERATLKPFFAPETVAVVGASVKEGSVGNTVLWNLVSNPFEGTVFPVNPNHHSVMGIKAYPDVAALPETAELAIIATPAPTVPDIISQCVDAGVSAAIILSAGFKETGERGAELERKVLERAQQAELRIVGPNCLGVMNTKTHLNATFANGMARSGSVGFVSQSGALCTTILDWSLRENVGFSAFVSVGSMLDVGWADLLHYLGDDPATQSIVMYMETVGDARSFLSAAREVAPIKPVIVIKPGRTQGAARAAASHTGSLTGSDEVLQVAFSRSGVLRVNSISELFNMAGILAKQPRPKGSRLTILTNAGGPGVLATGALILSGGALSELSEDVVASLDEILPDAWSHANPVDILGDAGPDRYIRAVEIAAEDPNSNGLLVILTPQAMTDATGTAEGLQPYAHQYDKPVLASWMGGGGVEPGESVLNEAGIPTFPYPDMAARLFNYMWRYADNLRDLYQTPVYPQDDDSGPDRARAQEIISTVQAAGRALLTEYETKQLLETYDIPTVPTRIAASEDEAVEVAEKMGYPVVLKVHSETITHKTDVGGVRLNLSDEVAVREAYQGIATEVSDQADTGAFMGVSVQPMVELEGYELIVGSSFDSQFGPVMLFGSGGELVEVNRDRALALPPLNAMLARRMMIKTRIYKALKGVRGRRPVDLHQLETIIVRFSQLIIEQNEVKELDINPLLASPERVVALDARAVLHKDGQGPLPRSAIRPYPAQYIKDWTMKDGTPVVIRPVRPEDESLLFQFHRTLSEEDLEMLQPMPMSERMVQDRLSRLCFKDYQHEVAFVVERQDRLTGDRDILAIAQLSGAYRNGEARFSVLVSDQFQGFGLGTELLRQSLAFGRAEGMKRIVAYVSPANEAMLQICDKFGFQSDWDREDGRIKAAKDLA